MKKSLFVLLFACLSTTLHGYIRLNDVMTPEEQRMTGVDQLSAKQRAALQSWMNKKFLLKEVPPEYSNEKIYVIENYNGGTRLYMSNKKTYEVAPEDRDQAAFWISPFPISIDVNPNNHAYPLKLVNNAVGASIAVRELSEEEIQIIEEDERIKRQNKALEEELKALQAPPAHDDHSHPHPHPEPKPQAAPEVTPQAQPTPEAPAPSTRGEVKLAPTSSLPKSPKTSSPWGSDEWEEEIYLEMPQK